MNKLLSILVIGIIMSLQVSAKEVFILVDTSTKLNNQKTNNSLKKVLGFNKKSLENNFLEYGDTVSSFYMTGEAEDLTIKPFDSFELIESKKVRKKFKNRRKAMYKTIEQLSANEIPKILTVPTTDIVFCMDSSGSMMGNGGANYNQAKDIAMW